MKNLKVFTLLFCFLAGCSTTCPPEPEPASLLFRIYEFANESGHTVSIVPPVAIYPERPHAFDSLVLRHGEQFAWIEDNMPGKIQSYTESDIYYDGHYKISAKDLEIRHFENSKSFQLSKRFESSMEDTLTCYTYTFTKEDYNYAIEHGVNLKAEKGESLHCD